MNDVGLFARGGRPGISLPCWEEEKGRVIGGIEVLFSCLGPPPGNLLRVKEEMDGKRSLIEGKIQA